MLNLSVVDNVLLDALENASESIVIFDAAGLLVGCSKLFREIFSYSDHQVTNGTPFQELLKWDLEKGNIPPNVNEDTFSNYLEQRLTCHYDKNNPLELQLQNGRWIKIEDNQTPLGAIISIHVDITHQKRSETLARRSSDLFDVAFNANNVSCTITEMKTGKYLYVNNAWCEHVGFSRGEAIGKTAVDLNVWGSSGARADLINKLRETPSINNLETQVRNRAGKFYNVLMNLEVIYMDDVECLFISSRDITENKRIEKAIEISDRRFQVMFENALMGMALADSTTFKVLIANQKYREILGVGDIEIGDVDWRKLTHPEDLEEDLDNMRRMNAGEISGYGLEKRYVLPDGSLRWVELFVHDVTIQGDVVKIQHFVMLIDITAKKEAELELQVSRDRFSNFTKASTDWYWETDKEIRFSYISSVVSRSTGRAEKDYIGRTQKEIYGEEEYRVQEGLKALDHALENRESFRDLVFYRINRDTGKKVWLRTSGQPYQDNSGAFLGYRGSTSDVTQQLELEEKLQQSQKMEAVGQLTGGVAHDFNNLLAVIQGNVELVSEALDEGRSVHSSELEPVLKATGRGAELTQSMLAFSRKQELSPRTLRLDLQVEKLVALLQRTIGETITISTKFEIGLWYCKADPGKVENALLNLCLNARDAMPEGGQLTISAKNVELDEGYAALQSDVRAGKYVALSISDTGTGIEESELEHVIEPFYTTKEIGKGTGLGLSMVYGFARQSKGYLTIDSEVGAGTTVALFLPFAEDENNSGVRTKEKNVATDTISVLVVEDDKDVRELTVSQLKLLGYEVREAPDGDIASDILRRHASDIDILLTDAILPGKMNGAEVADLAVQRNAEVKVIVMSGYDRNILKTGGQDRTEFSHIQKPFRKAELAEKIVETLLKKN